jgi:hypothetical protein
LNATEAGGGTPTEALQSPYSAFQLAMPVAAHAAGCSLLMHALADDAGKMRPSGLRRLNMPGRLSTVIVARCQFS